MSATVDQFCDKLRDRLNAIEEGLESVKANMQTHSEAAEEAVRAKLNEAHTRLEAEREHVERTKASLRALALQKINESKEAVNEWKAKREVRKLQVRADKAETYAADAVAYALATIDEAEEAVLGAAVARMDAEAAK
jgi:tetrahydromethanopterin S-methyltransferase subunit G